MFSAKPFFMSDEFGLVDASMGPLLWRLPVLSVEITGNAGKARRLATEAPGVDLYCS